MDNKQACPKEVDMTQTILIVEDEPAIADTIQYALETEGFKTFCAGSGSEALTLITDGPVNLIVLDVGLPDINGFELCKKIRLTSTVPILFLTARSDEIDRVVGLEIGGDDYVTKPFSPRELSARIKAILRRTSEGGKKYIENHAFNVNEQKQLITCYGVRLTLSRYEYLILKTLINRPGRVYSREQLMEMVWDEPEASMDRTVDAHIKNLRAKLKELRPDFSPIVTHRGSGYSLKENL